AERNQAHRPGIELLRAGQPQGQDGLVFERLNRRTLVHTSDEQPLLIEGRHQKWRISGVKHALFLDQRRFDAGTSGQKSRGADKLVSDIELAALYRRSGEMLGRHFIVPGAEMRRAAASTDMGNVSLVFPTIHPIIGINSLPAVNHQPEFTASCITQAADQAIFDGSIAMAWTAIDAASDPKLRARLMSAQP